MTTLFRIDIPACDYDSALRLQQRCVRDVQADPSRAYLILTEHEPPVITIGRRGGRDDILATDEQLAQRGIEVRACTRGGQVTLHAPGQLVAYVVMRLGGRRSIHGHVRSLEDAMIRTLAAYGVDAQAQCDGAGVWVDQRKIASVGVAVDHWVSYHGLAANICNDLSLFDWVVPCGQSDVEMTRLGDLAPRPIEVGPVADAFAAHFADRAGLAEVTTVAASDLPMEAEGLT